MTTARAGSDWGTGSVVEKLVTDVPALFTCPPFYLVNEYIPAPAMPDRFADVPFPLRQARYFVKDYANGGTTVFVQQPAARIEDRTRIRQILCIYFRFLTKESLHFRKFVNQIRGQTIDSKQNPLPVEKLYSLTGEM